MNKSEMDIDGEYYVLNGGKNPSGFTDSWNVEKDTITISEGGNSCGYVKYNTENFYCGGHCYYLKSINNIIDKYYLFHYLKFKEKEIMKLRVGSGLPNIQKRDVENIKISNINYDKQKYIGIFFNNLNEKITLIEDELSEIKEYKKGILSKMFI